MRDRRAILQGTFLVLAEQVLIIGGAGFIGSHLADELLRTGYRVRVLDCLDPQVHPSGTRPGYLHPDVELIVGDIRDADAVRRSLANVDAVFNYAALVGVGQSMYQIARYTSVNNLGTATLLECLLEHPVRRYIVASSMSLYGEGRFVNRQGQDAAPAPRTREQLEAHRWEVCSTNGEFLTPLPTPETKTPALASVYALSKYDQERLSLITGHAYGISTVALRFFNVFGTRQALSNPYTGVLAIFASRFLNGRAPLVNEDGCQMRDFVSVYDIARASRLALEAPEKQLAGTDRVFNVGSGRAYSIREVGELMATALNLEHIRPEITGKYRIGDIRHCFADVSEAQRVLGYNPQVALEDGLRELADWLPTQTAQDNVEAARAELARRGLAIG